MCSYRLYYSQILARGKQFWQVPEARGDVLLPTTTGLATHTLPHSNLLHTRQLHSGTRLQERTSTHDRNVPYCGSIHTQYPCLLLTHVVVCCIWNHGTRPLRRYRECCLKQIYRLAMGRLMCGACMSLL